MAAAAPAPLTADLEHGLRRLKALVETEIAARDASNTRLRTKQACFPTTKTIESSPACAGSPPNCC